MHLRGSTTRRKKPCCLADTCCQQKQLGSKFMHCFRAHIGHLLLWKAQLEASIAQRREACAIPRKRWVWKTRWRPQQLAIWGDHPSTGGHARVRVGAVAVNVTVRIVPGGCPH